MPEPFRPWDVSPAGRTLYLTILHTGAPTDADADAEPLAELLRFGLVVPHPHEPAGQYIALSPAEAANRRRDQLLTQVSDAMTGAVALPASVQDLAIAWQQRRAQQAPSAGTVEHLEGVERINARISELVAGTTSEILAAQPGGPRPASTLALALPRDLDALHRGVSMRTLYMDSVRTDDATAQWAAQMTAAGAHIRVTAEPFMRSIILDRRWAVLSDETPWVGPGDEPARAIVLEDEALVAYVAAMVDRDWARATVWKGDRAPAAPAAARGPRLTGRQQQIAQHLAAGAAQAGVAAALGISERAVQGELLAMRRALGCASNAALLYELGRLAGRAERRRS
ncbi:TrmB family transcriptional regulator [Kitasatospora sp. MBT63]|uniref:TrmB family transcriptional regulator n=1 Tax=Kitasatospora sp. MBT63 TaxID=1444768 RepID=UPI00053B78CD|nr:hypothetical protein [Kitasatospora sp. MBT63]